MIKRRRPVPRRSKRKPVGKVHKAKVVNRAKRITPKVWKRLLDRLCGLIVKERDNWRCVNCGSTKGPQWAHYFSRRYHGVRWDLRNSCCLCSRCHFYFTSRPHEWEKWLQQRLGLVAYFDMQDKAFQVAKPDYAGIWAELLEAAPAWLTAGARAEAEKAGVV